MRSRRTTVWPTWAGLWMRVDGQEPKMLAFDNMQGRPIQGTTAWKRYEVILDVDPQATAIAFGILWTRRGRCGSTT
jgi:hypothetical protein